MTRRDFSRLALAALPAANLLAKPNSKIAGVQIGIILSPTALKDIPVPADQELKTLLDLGINAVEIQDVRVETWAGGPSIPDGGRGMSAERREARAKAAQALKDWRLAASMDKYKSLRAMYKEAGVDMYAFRLANITPEVTDAELAYFFNTAEALGSRQITLELPTDAKLSQRFGDMATKHKMMIGYHNHTQVNANSWDTALEQSKYNGINFDVGHYAAAVSQSPIPFIEKHHDRIASLHLKDRKFGTNGGQNTPWGQGDTPLKEVLQMMRREKYKFPAAIEFEYRVPEGSTTMAELRKCLDYCKSALS